jgi:hypothetical protein
MLTFQQSLYSVELKFVTISNVILTKIIISIFKAVCELI